MMRTASVAVVTMVLLVVLGVAAFCSTRFGGIVDQRLASVTTTTTIQRKQQTEIANIMKVECYNKKLQTSTMVTLEEFWTNDQCSLDLTNTTLFMHIGKAGGGSVGSLAHSKYKLRTSKCHPTPGVCKKFLPQVQRILINIRDPVDRFVSAFDWRGVVFCGSPEVDKRIRAREKGVIPEKYCKVPTYPKEKKEAKAIQETYHYNVNKFAEALCDHTSPRGDLAREHATFFGHLGSPLTKWLEDFIMDQPSHNNNQQAAAPYLQEIVAMVMEFRDYPFEQTIANALDHIIAQEYNNDTSIAEALAAAAPLDNDKEAALTEEEIKAKEAAHMHSSQSNVLPGGITKTPVSELGECCIARHLKKDYQLLSVMANMETDDRIDPRLAKACQWGSPEDTKQCIESLRSMIQRRQAYLTDISSTSCEEVLAS